MRTPPAEPAVSTASMTGRPGRAGMVLLSLILVAAVANLNLSVANVALPDIGTYFDASQTALNLVAVGYSLGLAASVLYLGALGDRYGRKSMAIGGVLLSIPACLVAAWAPSIEVLVAARILGGLSAGMAYPTTLALITALWSGSARTKSIALWSGTGGAIASLGPLVSGALLEHFYWGSVFLVTLPLAVVALLLALKFIPSHVNETSDPVDNLGGILSVALVGSLILAINFAPVPDEGALVASLVVIAAAARHRVRPASASGRQSLVRLGHRRPTSVLGRSVRGHHRVRVAHGRHVHRAAVPPERVGLLDAKRRRGDPACRDPHGARRPSLRQAGRRSRRPVHLAHRLCVRVPRLPDDAPSVEGGQQLLAGRPGLRVRRDRRRVRRDPGVALR